MPKIKVNKKRIVKVITRMYSMFPRNYMLVELLENYTKELIENKEGDQQIPIRFGIGLDGTPIYSVFGFNKKYSSFEKLNVKDYIEFGEKLKRYNKYICE